MHTLTHSFSSYTDWISPKFNICCLKRNVFLNFRVLKVFLNHFISNYWICHIEVSLTCELITTCFLGVICSHKLWDPTQYMLPQNHPVEYLPLASSTEIKKYISFNQMKAYYYYWKITMRHRTNEHTPEMQPHYVYKCTSPKGDILSVHRFNHNI